MRSVTVSGDALKAAREDAELTQQGLADRVGCTKWCISKIEAGARQPSGALYGRICRALGVDKQTLLEQPRREVA